MTVKEYSEGTKSQDEEAKRLVLDIFEELAPEKVKIIDEDETSYIFKVGTQIARIDKDAEALIGFMNGFRMGINC